MNDREWIEAGGFDRYWLPQSTHDSKVLEGRLRAIFRDDDFGTVVTIETPDGELVKAPGHRELVTKVREAKSDSGEGCEIRIEFLGMIEGGSAYHYKVLHRRYVEPHLQSEIDKDQAEP